MWRGGGNGCETASSHFGTAKMTIARWESRVRGAQADQSSCEEVCAEVPIAFPPLPGAEARADRNNWRCNYSIVQTGTGLKDTNSKAPRGRRSNWLAAGKHEPRGRSGGDCLQLPPLPTGRTNQHRPKGRGCRARGKYCDGTGFENQRSTAILRSHRLAGVGTSPVDETASIPINFPPWEGRDAHAIGGKPSVERRR